MKHEATVASRSPGASILGELASDLAGGNDLPELLRRFLEPILRMSGAVAGAVRTISDTGERMQLVGCVGMDEHESTLEQSVRRGCGACGAAATDGVPIWASDLSTCARLGHQEPQGGPFARMLAVPLQHRGRTLGVYNLFFGSGAAPGVEVQAVLKSVGELLGLALNNARLEREQLRATVVHERQMMAAEVHDSIAQTLAFVKMRLPLLEQAVQTHDASGAQRYIGDLRSAVGEVHGSLRSIINEFRTPPDPLGLDHALRERLGQLRERHGIQAELSNQVPDLALPIGAEAQVVQIVSEALANIARHARATHAWLSIVLRDGRVEVQVEDDGCGLSSPAGVGGGHHGIEIMRERARRIGGQLELRTRPGAGTTVRLHFPAPVATRS